MLGPERRRAAGLREHDHPLPVERRGSEDGRIDRIHDGRPEPAARVRGPRQQRPDPRRDHRARLPTAPVRRLGGPHHAGAESYMRGLPHVRADHGQHGPLLGEERPRAAGLRGQSEPGRWAGRDGLQPPGRGPVRGPVAPAPAAPARAAPDGRPRAYREPRRLELHGQLHRHVLPAHRPPPAVDDQPGRAVQAPLRRARGRERQRGHCPGLRHRHRGVGHRRSAPRDGAQSDQRHDLHERGRREMRGAAVAAGQQHVRRVLVPALHHSPPSERDGVVRSGGLPSEPPGRRGAGREPRNVLDCPLRGRGEYRRVRG